MNRSVAFVYPYAFQYRMPFHERLRFLLAQRQIDYEVIYSPGANPGAPRGDLDAPPWAHPVNCRTWRVAGVEVKYQHALKRALQKDLVIIQQENKLLVNYAIQLLAKRSGTRVAFFGHGRNFQSGNQGGLSEKFKSIWINKVDWWFAYTNASAEIVARAGFPRDRTTIFNNAIDIAKITEELETISCTEQTELRNALVEGSRNVGVYLGALYPLKRMGFLLEASLLIQKEIPDFHLLVIGAGEDAALVEASAASRPWIHYPGPKFGREKVVLVSLCKLMFMPGAAGLSVLDSFAFGMPMIATKYPFHGPEIEYLIDGQNGVKEIEADDLQGYADAAVRLLKYPAEHARLAEGARASASRYSIEDMAGRVAAGIDRVLAL